MNQGHTELQANIIFVNDHTVASKYKKIYFANIPNYIPPIPMDIDPEIDTEIKNNIIEPTDTDMEYLNNPPDHAPVLRRNK